MEDIFYATILEERSQGHKTRAALYQKIEQSLGLPLISYFVSFIHPVMISDEDYEMLEQIIRSMDLSKGLALLICAPGGSGLAAERIINILRGYSKTGKFTAIVPGKAKSAATMICMGAEKIIMGIGAELGPIDPQINVRENNTSKIFSAISIIESYKELFDKATKEKGRLEPYLQQLGRYDAREINSYQTAIDLSTDIVVKYLKTGMLCGKSDAEIKEKIQCFIDPKLTKNHGRPIGRNEALKAGLNISNMEDLECCTDIFNLYTRLNNYTKLCAAKAIESRVCSFNVPIP